MLSAYIGLRVSREDFRIRIGARPNGLRGFQQELRTLGCRACRPSGAPQARQKGWAETRARGPTARTTKKNARRKGMRAWALFRRPLLRNDSTKTKMGAHLSLYLLPPLIGDDAQTLLYLALSHHVHQRTIDQGLKAQPIVLV